MQCAVLYCCPIRVQRLYMPARGFEKKALLYGIEYAAIESRVEPLFFQEAPHKRYLQQFLRREIVRLVGKRCPARHEYLVGIEDQVDAFDVAQIPVDIIPIIGPLVEG